MEMLWTVNALTLSLMLVSSSICFVSMGIYYLHMYQLNGYKIKENLRWICKNFSRITVRFIVVIPALIIALFFPHFSLVCVLFFSLAAFLNRPRRAKKPFAYTNRIKRLCVTMTLLFAAVVIAPAVVYADLGTMALWLSVLLILMPLFVLLCFIINKPVESLISWRYVRDAKKIISSCKELKVIGVTGSFGKTSVKYCLEKILSAKYNVLKTPGNYNTTMGVVKTIREQLKASHEVFICEMGARNIKDIEQICEIVHPEYGIITSIGEQHLETFKSVDNIIKTKFELYASVNDKKKMFLNFDNEYIRKSCNKNRCVSYGVENEDADYFAYDINVSEKGTSFKLRFPDGSSYDFQTPLIGKHNILNIAAAASAAHSLGVTPDDIAVQVRKLEAVPHRMQLVNSGRNIIIDDAYNSNPTGAEAALETLSMFSGTRILITPGMVELGTRQAQLNREFGMKAAGACDYAVLVGRKQTRDIYDGLLQNDFDKERIYIAASLDEAITIVNGIDSSAQKVILLENDLPDNY